MIEGKIKMVGFDTADVQIAAMKEGIFQALDRPGTLRHGSNRRQTSSAGRPGQKDDGFHGDACRCCNSC